MKNYNCLRWKVEIKKKGGEFFLSNHCDDFSLEFIDFQILDEKKPIRIDKVFDKNTVRVLISDFKYLEETNEILTSIKEINNKLWDIKMFCKEDVVNLIATRITTLEQVYLKNKGKALLLKHGDRVASDVVLLKVKGDKFSIKSAPKNIIEKYNISVGDNVAKVLNQFLNFKSTQILFRCIENKEILSLFDSFVDYNTNDKKYLYIVLVPICNDDKYFLLSIYNLTREEYYEGQVLEENVLVGLTKRENEIAELLAEGNTIKYISYSLQIAEGTVKKTISNIYKKIGVNSRVEFIRKVLKD